MESVKFSIKSDLNLMTDPFLLKIDFMNQFFTLSKIHIVVIRNLFSLVLRPKKSCKLYLVITQKKIYVQN